MCSQPFLVLAHMKNAQAGARGGEALRGHSPLQSPGVLQDGKAKRSVGGNTFECKHWVCLKLRLGLLCGIVGVTSSEEQHSASPEETRDRGRGVGLGSRVW